MQHLAPNTQTRHPGVVHSLPHQVADLNRRFAPAQAEEAMAFALSGALGDVALVSSFGADSVVLLHMASRISKTTPVIFIDTEMLFEETLAYQQAVTAHLGLRGVLVLRAGNSAVRDPGRTLHLRNPDACCNIRKTQPLQTALQGFDGWISGRKRHQGGARKGLELFEADPATGRIKVNPLAHWSAAGIAGWMTRHDLPRHPLVAQGYPSIGCAPCTASAEPGEDPRAGRWKDTEKEECGIHFSGGRARRTGGSS